MEPRIPRKPPVLAKDRGPKGRKRSLAGKAAREGVSLPSRKLADAQFAERRARAQKRSGWKPITVEEPKRKGGKRPGAERSRRERRYPEVVALKRITGEEMPKRPISEGVSHEIEHNEPIWHHIEHMSWQDRFYNETFLKRLAQEQWDKDTKLAGRILAIRSAREADPYRQIGALWKFWN